MKFWLNFFINFIQILDYIPYTSPVLFSFPSGRQDEQDLLEQYGFFKGQAMLEEERHYTRSVCRRTPASNTPNLSELAGGQNADNL